MDDNSYQKASELAKRGLKDQVSKVAKMLEVTLPASREVLKDESVLYTERKSIADTIKFVNLHGMRISDRFIRRYHLSLINKGFVILSGISGTGKTWLTELYAESIGAKYLNVPVAPNWTSNEDLLGFYNPLDNQYSHTTFSLFLKEAQNEYETSLTDKRPAIPYHVVLDEMNLARVEFYFAKFLSLLEIRNRGGKAIIEIPPDNLIMLTPNLFFIGTINVDETTHGFADKVYDRAQLIEILINEDDIKSAIGDEEYSKVLFEIWEVVHEIAPFAFRVIGDVKKYITDGYKMEVSWQESLDEQVLQKILPKLKINDDSEESMLITLKGIFETEGLTLSHQKVESILERYSNYGFATYF